MVNHSGKKKYPRTDRDADVSSRGAVGRSMMNQGDQGGQPQSVPKYHKKKLSDVALVTTAAI